MLIFSGKPEKVVRYVRVEREQAGMITIEHQQKGRLLMPTQDDAKTATLPTLVSRNEFAKFLGVHVKTLDRLGRGGLVPKPDVLLGKSPRWRLDTIERFISDGGLVGQNR